MVANLLYFAGYPPEHGVELWVTNGTPGGSRRDSDAIPGTRSVHPDQLAAVGYQVVFAGFRPEGDREFWISDGTASGTRLLKSLAPGDVDGEPAEFVPFQGGLALCANDGEGMKLWATDGTVAGTRLLVSRSSASFDSSAFNLTASGNLIYFNRFAHGRGTAELRRTDGTAEGTFPVISIPGIRDENSVAVTSYSLHAYGENSVLWTPWHPELQTELWGSDGTVKGSELIQDFSNSTSIDESAPRSFATLDGTLYFMVSRLSSWELWKMAPGSAAVRLRDAVHGSKLHVLQCVGREARNHPSTWLYAYDGTVETRRAELMVGSGTSPSHLSRQPQVAPVESGPTAAAIHSPPDEGPPSSNQPERSTA